MLDRMSDICPDWLLSLRALMATSSPPALAVPIRVGFRVDGAEFCCDSTGRAVEPRSATGWFEGASKVFEELCRGETTPQKACADGRLQVSGDAEVLCWVSMLWRRTGDRHGPGALPFPGV